MNFTDIFIRRPVLATVISLMILVLGARAYLALPINQYPRTENAVVTVSTTYYGADPATVAGFITTPLENAIAQDCTLARMAHAQGGGFVRRTERRVLNAEYVKTSGVWAIAKVEFANEQPESGIS